MSRFGVQLPFTKDDTVIELGGGDAPMFRPNVDIRPSPTVDFTIDLGSTKVVPPELFGKFNGVYSAYALEHVSWRQVGNFVSLAFKLLKSGGIALFIVPNLIEQAKYVLAKEAVGEFGDNEVCCIFGDQNYAGADWRANAHSAGFSPATVTKLFRDAGFLDVLVLPHPDTDTDMIVEARKAFETSSELALKAHSVVDVDGWNPDERKRAYDQEYFNGGGKFGGYAHEGYWDYPVHAITVDKIRELNPTSVLEIGPARGYVLKRLEDKGIPVCGLEVSEHCYATRVTDQIVTFDVTQFPWPIKDGAFDLAFSNAVLEHIPEQYIHGISQELHRVSRRGLHGISFKDDDDGFDKTHCTLRDREWWVTKLGQAQVVVDKEELEAGNPRDYEEPLDGLLKLNIGSFRTMFKHGWVNVDQHDLSVFADMHRYRFVCMDALSYLNSLKDGQVDLIYHAHFLEHLSYLTGAQFLNACERVMKPGAVMRVIVPDAEALAADLIGDTIDRHDALLHPSDRDKSATEKYFNLMMSNHQSIYNVVNLTEALEIAGFKDIRLYKFREGNAKILRETTDSLPDLSLYMEATK